MNLIPCPACAQKISSEARASPQCGQPVGRARRWRNILKFLAAGVFVLLAIWFLISTWTDIQHAIAGPIQINAPK